MGEKFRGRGVFLSIFIISAVLFTSGCAIMPHSYTYGKPIKEKTVRTIQTGSTTKDEIIQWFGIPDTMQIPGEKKDIPQEQANPPAVFTPRVIHEPYFELFSSKHKIINDHRIYVYTYTMNKGMNFNTVGFGTASSRNITDKLLVLINEKTGIVEDYIFTKQN